MSEWTKIEPNQTPTWNDKDIKEGSEIQGKLKEVKHGVGPNESTIYTLETKDGDTGVWGSTVLDARLSQAEEGDEVYIKYKGYTKSPKSGREYKDYEVFRKKGIPTVEEPDDIKAEDLF